MNETTNQREALTRRSVLSASGAGALVVAVGAAGAAAESVAPSGPAVAGQGPALLCEPYQLDPTRDGTHVVWHTETAGSAHAVLVGPGVAQLSHEAAVDAASGKASGGPGWRRFTADTDVLSQTSEDASSAVPGRTYAGLTRRPIHRHMATVTGLGSAPRVPYRVVSVEASNQATVTQTYSLRNALRDDEGGVFLLTSDHQLKVMTPANLEKVSQTIGTNFDAILLAGDLVNVPDRASEWFDSSTGLAFFAGLTGRARRDIAGRTYVGAPLLQNVPFYPAVGNHEVMGRRTTQSLDRQFNDTQPRSVAEGRWQQGQGSGRRAEWVTSNSWNTKTYEELFPFPRNQDGSSAYWAASIGNVRVVTLFVTQIWRSPSTAPGVTGKFQDVGGDPSTWGYGQHIFEPIEKGSTQYDWLVRELRSPQWRDADYRVVMYHHPGHGLGDNSAPPFTNPVQTTVRDPETGAVTGATYHYPLSEDHILRDLEPLFSEAGAHLVLNGHSHLWNRFRNAAGVNWLETSNVGNTYGAYLAASGASRNLPADASYLRQGDPGGLEPVVPTIAPVIGPDGRPQPYLSSNTVTSFSVLDSTVGVVRSYRFDTSKPDSEVVLFDEFPLR